MDSWVVVQHCAKSGYSGRLTRASRVDTANLGPRVFAYQVRDAIGQLGEILTYSATTSCSRRNAKEGRCL